MKKYHVHPVYGHWVSNPRPFKASLKTIIFSMCGFGNYLVNLGYFLETLGYFLLQHLVTLNLTNIHSRYLMQPEIGTFYVRIIRLSKLDLNRILKFEELCHDNDALSLSLSLSLSHWCTPTFTDEIFSRPFFCEFHWQFFYIFASLANSFSWWLHLNNLCCKSIAQDGMQVLQFFFAMATSK